MEFMTGYMPAMDFKDEPDKGLPKEDWEQKIEEPILPIGEIGTTSVDVGRGNILQELEGNIKVGAKKIQLVFSAPQRTSPNTYGKAVRQAVKEKARATGVDIIGIELSPNVVNGLAGLSREGISESTRQEAIDKVRDALRFAADVSEGGCVDLWSSEFQRNITDAKWNKGEFFANSPAELIKNPKNDRERELKERAEQEVVRYLANERTGQVIPVGQKAVQIPVYNEKTGEVEVKDWEYFVKLAKEDKKGRKAEELVYDSIQDSKIKQIEGQQEILKAEVKKGQSMVQQLTETKDDAMEELKSWSNTAMLRQQFEQDPKFKALSRKEQDEEIARIQGQNVKVAQRKLADAERNIEAYQFEIKAREEQKRNLEYQKSTYEQEKEQIKSFDKIAKDRVFDSYSELGIEAMRIQNERNKKPETKLKKDLYVGPELGHAGETYGGHPAEFKEIVQQSRKMMADKLVQQGYDEGRAKDEAKKHIKGMLDTSHLTMWFKHYAKKPGETDESHVKRFNTWAKDQVGMLVKEGVVGGVQVVDSITGDHAHLPVGQGLFDTAGMIKTMKEAGFKGPVIAEGHEEEQFGKGRILTETWRALGANVSSYGGPGGNWRDIQSSYFSRGRPTRYIVGSYVPGNAQDWQPWSGTPLE